MWRKGTVAIPDGGDYIVCKYEAKQYDEGSVYGINEGRISKLCITIDGRTVCNYDRGWDIEPTCEAAEMALAIILKEHN